MKNLLLYISLLFLPILLFGQDPKSETQKLVKKLMQVNELHHKHVGVGGMTSEQYYTFLSLRDKASISELISLLNHSNAVVKGYASWALADKKYPALDKVLIQFLDSKEMVKTFSGCILSKDELSSEFYYRVLYQDYDNPLSKKDSLFFVEQIKKIDSAILYYSGNTSLLDQALEHNNANLQTYDRVRKLALKDKNEQAIIELAKYRKADDIASLKKLGKKSFLAISYFPDKGFWSFLETYLPTVETLDFYLAVASFKNSSATLTLTNLFNQLDKQQKAEQIRNLDEALIKQYCTNYQKLLLDIWDKYKSIDLTITNILINDNPEKAAEGFAKGLLNDKEFNLLELDYNYGTKDSILPIMLAIIAKYDKEKLVDICKINIAKTEFLDLEAFLKIIKSNNIQSLTETLIAKLKVQKYPFDIFQLTETLLYFKNLDINLQVIEILRSNKPKWYEGNWAEHFKKLLKEYNIKV
jgi:hypothetical protein